jgi:hypothetical protein
MMMPPQGGMPQGGMPPEMMQQAPPQEQMPNPAEMHAAVVARLEELKREEAELMGILQHMEGAASPQMAGGPPMPMGGGGPPMGGGGPPMPMGGLLG